MNAVPPADGRLRRAVAADADRLALLGGATFLYAFAHDHPGDAIATHVAAEHSPAWYATALASADDALWIVETPLAAPIGYAMLTPTTLGDAAAALELKRLYVLAPWQGSGWGERLLGAVEAEARERGATRLLLCVYSANVRAQRFYARHGFADTGRRVDFLVGETAFVDLLFAKPLQNGIGSPAQAEVRGRKGIACRSAAPHARENDVFQAGLIER